MTAYAKKQFLSSALCQISAISVIGSSHVKAGSSCQDAFTIAHAGQWHILVLADGAGSAPKGGMGSRMAACRCAYFLRQRLNAQSEASPASEKEWRVLLAGAFTESRTLLSNWAARQNIPIRELSTTLLVAVFGPELVAGGQIGDGAIVALEAGRYKLLTQPSHGERANETSMLTSKNYGDALHITVQERNVEALALFSDGLEYLTIRKDVPHWPFFEPVFNYMDTWGPESLCAELERLLTSDAVLCRTDDDKTLILASRHTQQEE